MNNVNDFMEQSGMEIVFDLAVEALQTRFDQRVDAVMNGSCEETIEEIILDMQNTVKDINKAHKRLIESLTE